MRLRNVNFRRCYMSGQLAGKKGDFEWIEAGITFRGEAKCGKQIPDTLYHWLEKDKNDFLIVKKDRKVRLWILTDKLMKELVRFWTV